LGMAQLPIMKDGEAVLRQKAKPVKQVNMTIRKLIDDMVDTMRAARGVGLAAPQVGVSKRVIVVETDDALYEIVNPEVVYTEGSEVALEGCLSVPGLVGEVARFKKVRVAGLDRAREVFEAEEEPKRGKPLRIVFMGTPEFAVPSLLGLLRDAHQIVAVVTQPDRPRGRGLEQASPAVKLAAQRHRLLVCQPRSVKSPDFIRYVEGLEPDLIVVVAFGRILPRALLEVPKLGAVNLHASLLPRYRGAAPIQRAIMAGERISGVTTMYMSEKMDEGDIILSKELPIKPDDTAGTLHDRMMHEGAHLLVETVRLVSEGRALRVPQDPSEATYAPPLTSEDEVIDWNKTAEEIGNLIRGLNPWPGAHTSRDGRKLKVFRAKVLDDASTGRPGEVVETRDKEGFVVQAGRGRVLVQEVQPEGGRRMDAASYLNGYRLRPGEVLGLSS